MSHYQQQYHARPQQPPHTPHTPISSPFYAARQRFEQQAYSAQPQQPQMLDHRQPAPPQHPQQQQRAGTQHAPSQPQAYAQTQTQTQTHHPQQQQRAGAHRDVRSQVPTQAHVQPQAQTHHFGHPQLQYAQGQLQQQQLYQSTYAQAGQRPQAQVQSPFASQYPMHVPPGSFVHPAHLQRTFSFPPPQAQVQPAPTVAPYQIPHPYTSAHHAQNPRGPAPQQQLQQIAQYGRPAAPPSVTSPTASGHAPPPANASGTVGRRPLPAPGASRPGARPLSMPPQPTQTSYPASSKHSFGHSSSSSLSHIIPKSSIRATSPLPSPSSIAPSFPNAPQDTSPTRRQLPSPASAPTSLPLASPGSGSGGIPRSANMQYSRSRSPSPVKQGPLPSGFAASSSVPASSKPLQRIATQRRALPHSPTAPPDLSHLQRSSDGLARRGTVSQMASRFAENSAESQADKGMEASSSDVPKTAPVASSSYTPRSPFRSSTLPATMQDTSPVLQTTYQAHSQQEQQQKAEQDDDDDSSESGLSVVHDEAVSQTRVQTPSPQYGIRDLPKRNTMNLGSNSYVAATKPEPPSPQYGIKNLPPRAKSELDRRRAWERAEQGMGGGAGPRSGISSGGSRSVFEPGRQIQPSSSPTRASVPSSPKKVHVPTLPPPVAAVAPSRSPQPQTPQQQQKLPMPAVVHPQPSYTERQPSWTYPTADLEKIQDRPPAGEQKSSMAFRFAALSLAEENRDEKVMPPLPPPTTVTTRQGRPRPPAQSSSSRSASPTKPYPFSTRTPRSVANLDLNLDDAPPPSLRRTPSPSSSIASSSVPSIPTIRTPEDGPGGFPPGQQSHGRGTSIPKINLPGDFDYDDDIASVPNVKVQTPQVVVSPKPMSPLKHTVPIINLPDDDEDNEVNGSGPTISVSAPASQTPETPYASMPVILDDLACSHSTPSSPTKSRGLPRPPSGPAGPIPTSSSSGSNLRSRGGGLVCGGCHESIIGRIVSAMGLRWHPQCFKCCTCAELLEHVSSYEHDAKPYCHLDYHELFAPRCYHCKTPIIDERFITLDDPALGKRMYHEQHFFCAECGDPFLAPSSPAKAHARTGRNEINVRGDGAFDLALDEDGDEVGFTVYRGHPYCEACHVRLRAPKCRGCKRSIRDGTRAVEALGGKWCYECFVCTGCQKPFEVPSFFQRGNRPFCEPCFSIVLRNEV